jgi:hypothetical protein
MSMLDNRGTIILRTTRQVVQQFTIMLGNLLEKKLNA